MTGPRAVFVPRRATASAPGPRRPEDTLEDVDAAALVGVSRLTIRAWARAGVVPAIEVDETWLFDVDDVLAYDAARRSRHDRREGRMDVGPLLLQIEQRGGYHGLAAPIGDAEKRALQRAREDGSLTVGAADRLAARLLGLPAWEVWGEEYLTA